MTNDVKQEPRKRRRPQRPAYNLRNTGGAGLGGGTSPGDNYLLQEDSSRFILENSSGFLLLENP